LDVDLDVDLNTMVIMQNLLIGLVRCQVSRWSGGWSRCHLVQFGFGLLELELESSLFFVLGGVVLQIKRKIF